MERRGLYESHPGSPRFSRHNDELLRCKGKTLYSTRRSAEKRKPMAVVNIDDRYGEQLLDKIDKNVAVITYGRGARADFRASNPRVEFSGTSYKLEAGGKSYLVRVPLIGRFNVLNSVAAVAGANALGIRLRG